MVAGKLRALVRWWEAVPSRSQGDLVAELNAFMFDPTMDTPRRSWADMQAINADYWASKKRCCLDRLARGCLRSAGRPRPFSDVTNDDSIQRNATSPARGGSVQTG